VGAVDSTLSVESTLGVTCVAHDVKHWNTAQAEINPNLKQSVRYGKCPAGKAAFVA